MRSNQYHKDLLNKVGKDVFISADVEIRRPELVILGSHIAIDTGFYLTTSAEIGDYVHIGPYVAVIGGAKGVFKMKDFCTIAVGSRIITGSDEHMGDGLVGPTIPKDYKDKIKYGPVIFEDFASIGTNVVVHPGVTLSEGSVVGSMSLLTKDTEPWVVYAGIPARPIRERPREKMIEYARSLGYNPALKGIEKIVQP